MCKILGVKRSNFYYIKRPKKDETKLENAIIKAFNASRKVYGSRKIKAEIAKEEFVASKRKIITIMAKLELVTKYTKRRHKAHKTKVNEDNIANVVDRNFDEREPLDVVVSDLTYQTVPQLAYSKPQ